MSANQTLDERYFDWLCNQVGVTSSRDPASSHILLAEQLYKTAFNDSLPNDQNRSLDGTDLRSIFLEVEGLTADAGWRSLDCSMFEMLVGLARRVAFHVDWQPSAAFWLMITNLELHKYTDERFNDGITTAVQYVLRTVNERTYEYNGQGGLFPLDHPQTDQRRVEIWYQMSAYNQENFTF